MGLVPRYPFRSPLQGGLKGLGARGGGGRRSEGRRGLHLRKASRRLEGGLKPSALKRVSRMLATGLYIRGLGMCKACTEAVHSEAL